MEFSQQITIFALIALNLGQFYVLIRKLELTKQRAQQIAHDLKSPLGALRALNSTLGQNSPQRWEILKSATDRISDLSNELVLPHQGLQLNSPAATSSAAQLGQIIEGLIRSKQIELGGDFRLQLRLFVRRQADEMPVINTTSLVAALSNLINNAAESYGPQHQGPHKVFIYAYLTDHKFRFAIRDLGCGIPHYLISRLGCGWSWKWGGAGLGTRRARCFAKKHGAEIKWYSKYNKGTLVVCDLPLSRGLRLPRKYPL